MTQKNPLVLHHSTLEPGDGDLARPNELIADDVMVPDVQLELSALRVGHLELEDFVPLRVRLVVEGGSAEALIFNLQNDVRIWEAHELSVGQVPSFADANIKTPHYYFFFPLSPFREIPGCLGRNKE